MISMSPSLLLILHPSFKTGNPASQMQKEGLFISLPSAKIPKALLESRRFFFSVYIIP
jgi:hypothetical protein